MQTIKIPKILLPDVQDMTAWAVNACDQFTSDAEYWRELEELVGEKPSALRLIFPEIYLKDNPEARINSINSAMNDYLESGVFKQIEGGFILVERTTESGTRTGLVLSIDLDDYSFEKGSQALIRSTEATITERIPPRVNIRKNAPVELPHAMLLYDDKENSVLNSIVRGDVLYDFELNMGGGHVKGTYVSNAEEIIEKFYALADGQACLKRYGVDGQILFAVGDGNHSLAAAKTCWENIKATLSEEERENHPARYALVEAVNIYDPALKFEPIHRLVKTVKPDLFTGGLKFGGKGRAKICVGGKVGSIHFSENVPDGIRSLDAYISNFILKNGGEVDYIHGDDEIKKFSNSGVGVILPAIEKDDFFRLIATGGNLPRKTFSMGEGNEKRYYIEAKAIKPDENQ
ncbi:MAG: DUF1015 domain-containing protein [Candidatus Coproplasma sp.]